MSGLVNALYQWARGDDARIADLVTERDALIGVQLSGGQASMTVNSGTINGKTFGAVVGMSVEQKLDVFTSVLELLGEITDPRPSVSYANFSELER